MARGPLRLPSAGTLLFASAGVALIVALLPARLLGWAGWFREPLEFSVAPVQAPVRSMVVWMRGADRPGNAGASERERELERQLAEAVTRLLRTEAENEMLRGQIDVLSRGLEATQGVRFRTAFAPVIGPGADPSTGGLKIRLGRMDEIDESGIAVVHGVHLVGRVARADSRVSWVIPVTERGAPALRGVVMLGEGSAGEFGPRCQLSPAGDGTLTGPLQWDPDRPWADEAVREGMEVRLDDPTWARVAQMLVVGKVESVESSEATPERRIVRVRPVYRLDRVSELVVRMPEGGSGETGGAP